MQTALRPRLSPGPWCNPSYFLGCSCVRLLVGSRQQPGIPTQYQRRQRFLPQPAHESGGIKQIPWLRSGSRTRLRSATAFGGQSLFSIFCSQKGPTDRNSKRPWVAGAPASDHEEAAVRNGSPSPRTPSAPKGAGSLALRLGTRLQASVKINKTVNILAAGGERR
jgi:hypothetical protein